LGDLIKVVDGKRTIDFQLLEEQYGPELVPSIKATFELCIEKEWDWDFKKLDESQHFVNFILYTPSICRFFEFTKQLKKMETFILNKWTIETVNNLMEEIVDSIEV
jgi:hypothetical protein